MRHLLTLCCFILLWALPVSAFGKDITSSFCENFTADQIPVGDFKSPLATPLSQMRITQIYHTLYNEGYCQTAGGQFSAGSSSCQGEKIYYGHDGLDLHPAGAKAGETSVSSVQNGLVVASHAMGAFSGWGESMVIATRPSQYSEEILTFHYHHLHATGSGDKYLTTRLLSACDQVKSGQEIAKEGGTPNWPTHLHISVKRWRNFTELRDRITKSPSLIYGYGYTFGDDGKVANFIDPEGLFFGSFREFTKDQKLNLEWQWAKDLTLFMRSHGWEFGLLDGRFGLSSQYRRRDAARWLKLALELPTTAAPLTDEQGKPIFTDLKSDDYDLPYISTLVHQKMQIRVIDGTRSCSSPGSKFCPDAMATKAEALKMVIAGFYQNEFISFYNNWIWKAAAPLAQNMLSKFKDVSPLSWPAPYIYFAWQKKLVGADPYFFPGIPVRKGELAKWLVLAYQDKHSVQSTFCEKLSCGPKYYCDEGKHSCVPIPACLPGEAGPCPLGGGYEISDDGEGAGGSDQGQSQGQGGAGGALSGAGGHLGSGGAQGSGSQSGTSTTKVDSGIPPIVSDAGQFPKDASSPEKDSGSPPPPACSCSSGVCCDGCSFIPASQICATYEDFSCQGISPGDNVQHRLSTRKCAGFSSECIGQLSLGQWATYLDCKANQQCVWSGKDSYCKDIPAQCVVKYTASPVGQSCYTNSNAAGSPTICLETKQQSGAVWQWRVCKQGGSFQNNYGYLLLDQNHLNQYLGNYSGAAGSSCSPWQSADFSYLKADGPPNGAGLKVQVLSPANCASAGCTYFSGFVTIYRNCL